MRLHSVALACTLSAAFLAPGRARGDDDKRRDPVTAEALFAEGRRLMAAGNYEAACPKFADSEGLDAAPGTALNLAICYEKAGKLATAWAAFQSAQTLASREGQSDRARAAKKEAAALEPKLSRLTIAVADSSQVQGLAIRFDDRAVEPPEWGVAVPRDGGTHEIAASAPGRKPWRTRVELRESGQRLTVDVPVLEEASPSPAPASAAPAAASGETIPAVATGTPRSESPPRDPSSPPLVDQGVAHPGRTQRVVGIVVAGAGVAAMGTAGILALVAKSGYDTAQGEHGTARVNDAASAVHLVDAASVVLGAGAAVAVAGAVVWFVAPRANAQVGTNGQAIFLKGTF